MRARDDEAVYALLLFDREEKPEQERGKRQMEEGVHALCGGCIQGGSNIRFSILRGCKRP